VLEDVEVPARTGWAPEGQGFAIANEGDSTLAGSGDLPGAGLGHRTGGG